MFVVWEPVLVTDWAPPSTATMERISDSRVSQFWDKHRLISHLLGEHDRQSIVWDFIAVYPAGPVWKKRPPPALFTGGPVVRVAERARTAISQAFAESVKSTNQAVRAREDARILQPWNRNRQVGRLFDQELSSLAQAVAWDADPLRRDREKPARAICCTQRRSL